MRFFENWWEHAPLFLRAVLMLVSIVSLLLGGAADHYWEWCY